MRIRQNTEWHRVLKSSEIISLKTKAQQVVETNINNRMKHIEKVCNTMGSEIPYANVHLYQMK